MDSEKPGGCQPAPQAGGGEGHGGGSLEARGSQIHDRESATFLKPGTTVYLKWKGQLLRCVTEARHDFNNAIVVSNGTGEYTVTADDLVSEEEYLKRVWESKCSLALVQYNLEIKYFAETPPEITKPAKRNKWIAEQLKITPREAAARLRACAHFKLIELPEEKK